MTRAGRVRRLSSQVYLSSVIFTRLHHSVFGFGYLFRLEGFLLGCLSAADFTRSNPARIARYCLSVLSVFVSIRLRRRLRDYGRENATLWVVTRPIAVRFHLDDTALSGCGDCTTMSPYDLYRMPSMRWLSASRGTSRKPGPGFVTHFPSGLTKRPSSIGLQCCNIWPLSIFQTRAEAASKVTRSV
jgi:hypothetical protein